jgi:hypothetical protein
VSRLVNSDDAIAGIQYALHSRSTLTSQHQLLLSFQYNSQLLALPIQSLSTYKEEKGDRGEQIRIYLS